MGNLDDLSGKKFGRLRVISRSRTDGKDIYYHCVCDCSPDIVIERHKNRIKFTKYPSCGCWYKETLKKYNEYDISGEHGICFIGHKVIDHINGNKKDNRKNNLRITTQTQNSRNIKKKQKNTTSKYIGVHSRNGRWYVSIGYNRKHYHLGVFDDEKEAALAYNRKAEELGFLTRNIIE